MCGCNTLESTTTGEVIEREELERVLGILAGLQNIDEMYWRGFSSSFLS